VAANAFTIPIANMKPGADFSCTLTNTDVAPRLKLTKISNGAVGPFTFTGSNGWTSQTITTVTSGTGVAGAQQRLTAFNTATAMTEAVPAGYQLASATCTGMGSGGTASLAGNVLTLDAAATAASSNIACTFTNTKLPTISLTKISNGGVGPFTFTGTNGWASQTITTATSGVGVTGATQKLTAASTATNIIETIPSGYALNSVVCSGLGAGGTATPNLLTGAVAFDAAATAAGSNIACTFTNGVPAMTVVKAVDKTTISNIATLNYTITVKNTGSAALTGLVVTDALTQTGSTITLSTAPTLSSGDTNLNSILDIGETWIYNAAYIVQDADINNGNTISNVATIKPNEMAAVVSNAATTTIVLTFPGSAAKACSGNDLAINGGFETPTHTPPPRNFYLVPDASVPGWSTTDTVIEIWDTGFVASGGQVFSFEGNSHAELNATISGTLTQTGTVHSNAELSVFWAHRGRKGPDVASMTLSDNSGALNNFGSFTDSTTAWQRRNATLVTGATASTFSMAYTAVSSTGGNNAIGNFLDGVEACQTFMNFTKTLLSRTDVDASGGDSAGDKINYQYTISNPAGNFKGLSAVSIIDDKIGTIAVPTPLSGDTNSNGILDVGEIWTVQASYTLTLADMNAGSVTNTAHASGSTGSNTIVSGNASVSATLTAVPKLAVTKTANLASVNLAGQLITYTIAVSNPGNVTVSAITVSDPLGTVICPVSGNATIASLAPSASQSCTLTYTVTQNNLNTNGGGTGKISNTATAAGSFGATPVSKTGSTTVNIVLNPKLTIVKTFNPPGPFALNATITYTYKVTNSGNVTMTAVKVADANNGTGVFTGPGNEAMFTDVAPLGDSTDAAVSGIWDALAPGDTLTFTATYVVTQHDVDFLQ
jgi:uncharacterized repeat protein (TIGR01451 family)